MAKRKDEIERTRERRGRRIREILAAPVFQAVVAGLRERLDINPEKIRCMGKERWQQVVEQYEPRKIETPDEFPSGWRPFTDDELTQADTDRLFTAYHLFYNKPLEAEKFLTLSLNILTSLGFNVDEKFLVTALCYDFEGAELAGCIRVIPKPVQLFYWYEPLAKWWSFEVFVERFFKPKPNHIYMDVTEATLDDIQARWGEVEEIQRRLGVPSVPLGRPKGAITYELTDRDKRLFEIYQAIGESLGKKGKRMLYSRRYNGIYDMVSKMYGREHRLPEEQYPPPDTVKRIIAGMKKKN